MGNWKRAAGALAVLSMVATGCIDESDPPAGSETHAAPVAAPGEPPAPTATITATLTEWQIALSADSSVAGAISFDVKNNGTESHAFEIEGTGDGEEWKTDPIAPGQSATLTVALHAGTYTVYCPIATGGEAHSDRGMRTTFHVR